MGSRARRWILGSLLALGVTAVAAVVGLQLLLRFDARPRDVEERLPPGPDGLLLRSLSYTDRGIPESLAGDLVKLGLPAGTWSEEKQS